jgi:hypothetical protein
MNYREDLINEFNKIGVHIERLDIPEILKTGADLFLQRRGLNTSEENMSSLYIVLNEARQACAVLHNVSMQEVLIKD